MQSPDNVPEDKHGPAKGEVLGEANPSVLIIYSHDNQTHLDRVLAFSNRLRSEGIDCQVDQYVPSPPEGWPQWMEREMRKAQFVLVVCTQSFLRRFNGEESEGVGLGARWEAHHLCQHLLNAGSENTKFIPVLFSDGLKEFVPIPLQSATIYRIEEKTDYDRLYWRLRGKNLTEKPDLGNLRPLPEKERKSVFITGFIDIDLWNAARWRGCAFQLDPTKRQAPTLVLLFENEEAARQIFEQWQQRLGLDDEFDELRVSLVEGDIPGKEPGYTVTIGANIENILKRADYLGIDMPRENFIMIMRYKRMQTTPGTTHLQDFKKDYARAGHYFLLPATFENYKIKKILSEVAIYKKRLDLRNVKDVSSPDDVDSVIFQSSRT